MSQKDGGTADSRWRPLLRRRSRRCCCNPSSIKEHGGRSRRGVDPSHSCQQTRCRNINQPACRTYLFIEGTTRSEEREINGKTKISRMNTWQSGQATAWLRKSSENLAKWGRSRRRSSISLVRSELQLSTSWLAWEHSERQPLPYCKILTINTSIQLFNR